MVSVRSCRSAAERIVQPPLRRFFRSTASPEGDRQMFPVHTTKTFIINI